MKLLMILQVLDALVSDVVTVLHAHPVDAGNALVGFFLGFFQRRGNGDNIQHAAALTTNSPFFLAVPAWNTMQSSFLASSMPLMISPDVWEAG